MLKTELQMENIFTKTELKTEKTLKWRKARLAVVQSFPAFANPRAKKTKAKAGSGPRARRNGPRAKERAWGSRKTLE